MEWNFGQRNLIPLVNSQSLLGYVSISDSGNVALVPYFNTSQGFVKYNTYKYDGEYRPWKRIGNPSRNDRSKDIIGDTIYAELDSNRSNKPNVFGNAVWSRDENTMIVASTEEIRIYDYFPPNYFLLEKRDLWISNTLLEMPNGDSSEIPCVCISPDGNVTAWSRKGHHLIRIATRNNNIWTKVFEINVGKRNVNFGFSMALNYTGEVLVVASENRNNNTTEITRYTKTPSQNQWTTASKNFNVSTTIVSDSRQLRSVAISDNGDTMMFGCLNFSRNGYHQAVTYRWTGTTWTIETMDINGFEGDYTVYLNPEGNRSTVTTQRLNNYSVERTSWIFKYHPNNGWEALGTPIYLLTASERLNYPPIVINNQNRITIANDVLTNNGPVVTYTYTSSPYPKAYGYWDRLGNGTVVAGDRDQDKFGYAAVMSNDGTTIAASAIGKDGIGEIKVFSPSNSLDTLEQKGNTITGIFTKGLLGNSVSLDKTGKILSLGSVNGISENYEYFPRFVRFKPESGVQGAIRFIKHLDTAPHFDGRSGGRGVPKTTVKIVDKTFPFIDTEGNVVYDTGTLEFTGDGRIYDDNDRSVSFFSLDMVYDASTLILGGTGTWTSDIRGTIDFIGRFKIHGTTRWSVTSLFGHDIDDDTDQAGEYRFDLRPLKAEYLNVSGSWYLQFGGRMLPDFLGSNGYGRRTKNVAMSSDGSTLLVGEPDSNNPNGGQVEMFKFVNGGWKWKNVFVGQPGEAFGHSLAISSNGRVFAIGSVTSKATDSYRGIVRIYYAQVSSGQVLGYSQILPDIIGENIGDSFGYSISVNESAGVPGPSESYLDSLARHSYITIGAPYYDTDKLNTGKIYKYSLQVGSAGSVTWKRDDYSSVGTFSYDYYGKAIDTSSNGQLIAVGAPSQVTGGFVSTIDVPIKAKLSEDIQSIYNKECLGMAVSVAEGAYGAALMASSPMYSLKNLAGGQVTIYTLKPFVFATILLRDPNQYDENTYAINKSTGILFNKVNNVWAKTNISVALSEVYDNVVVSYGKPGRNYTKPRPICFDLRNNVVYRRQGDYDWSVIKKILKYVLRGNTAPTIDVGVQDDFYMDVRSGLLYGPKTNGVWTNRKPFKLLGIKGSESIFVGSFVPESTDGNDDDYCINLVESIIYGPKASGVWPVFSTFHKTIIIGSETYINKNLGFNKDYYLNISSGELTGPKSELGWSTDPFRIPIDDLSILNNVTLYFGFNESPYEDEGNKGDYYIDFDVGILYGPKPTNTSWNVVNVPKLFLAKPALKGEQAPLLSDGIVSDFYINVDTLDFYGPKTVSGWGVPKSKFPLEISLYSVVLIGRKAPKEIEGREGEYFVNISDNTLYGPKAANAETDTSLWGPNRSWPKQAIIKSGNPIATDGIEGDYCYNSTSLELFFKARKGIFVSWESCGVKLQSGITSLLVGVYKDPTESDGNTGTYYYNRFSNQFFGPKTNKYWLENTSKFGNYIVGTVTSLPTDSVSSTFNIGRVLVNTIARDIYKFFNSSWEQTCLRLPNSIPTSSTILIGFVDPAANIGVSGNYFYNTTTNKIFGPKASNWPSGSVDLEVVAQLRTSNPKPQEGSNGDYAYNTLTRELYGPKNQYHWPLVLQKPRNGFGSRVNIVSSTPTSLVNGEYYYNTTASTYSLSDGTSLIPMPSDTIVESKDYRPLESYGFPGQYTLDSNTMTLYGPKTSTSWYSNSPYKLPNDVRNEGKILLVNSLNSMIGSIGDYIIDTTDTSISGPKDSANNFPYISPLYKVCFRIGIDSMYDTYGKIGDYAYDFDALNIVGPKTSNTSWAGSNTVKFVNFIEADADIIIGTDNNPPDNFGRYGDYYFANGEIRARRDLDVWAIEPEINANKRVIVRYGLPQSSVGSVGDYYHDLVSRRFYGPKTSGMWDSATLKLPNTLYDTSQLYYGTTSERSVFQTSYFYDTQTKNVSEPNSSNNIGRSLVQESLTPPALGEFVIVEGNLQYTIVGLTETLKLPEHEDIFLTSGPPTSLEGVLGDYAFDTINYILYGPKTSDIWAESKTYWKDAETGTANPTTSSNRKNRNVYLNRTTGEVFVYRSTAWESSNVYVTGLQDLTFSDFNGTPSEFIGVNGDYYFDTESFQVYGPKTNNVWPKQLYKTSRIGVRSGNTNNGDFTVVATQTSPTTETVKFIGPKFFQNGLSNPTRTAPDNTVTFSGIVKDSRILFGYGVPTNFEGNDSDNYFDVKNQTLYRQKDSVWPAGETTVTLTSVPVTTSGGVYIPTGSKYITATADTKFTIRAPDGTYTKVGETYPTYKANGFFRDISLKAVLITTGVVTDAYGLNGDYYFDSTTATMYGPKFEDVWPTYGIAYDIPYKPDNYYILITKSVQDIDNNTSRFNDTTLKEISKLVYNDFYFDPLEANLVMITPAGKRSIAKIAKPEPGFIDDASHGAWYINAKAKKLYGPLNDQGWNLGFNINPTATVLIAYRAPDILDGIVGNYYYNTATGDIYSQKIDGWTKQVSFDITVDFNSSKGSVRANYRPFYSNFTEIYSNRLLRGLSKNKVFVGDLRPKQTFGTDGDYYITYESGEFYGPKRDNVWSKTNLPRKTSFRINYSEVDYEDNINVPVDLNIGLFDGYKALQKGLSLGIMPVDTTYHSPWIFPSEFDSSNEAELFNKYDYLYDYTKNKIKTRQRESRPCFDIGYVDSFDQVLITPANYIKQNYSIDGTTVRNMDNLYPSPDSKISYSLPGIAPSNLLLIGIGIPPTEMGVTGDYYVNSITNTVYGPKSGLWPKHPVTCAKWTTTKNLGEEFLVDEGDYVFEKTSRTLFCPKDQEMLVPKILGVASNEIVNANRIGIAATVGDIQFNSQFTPTYAYVVADGTLRKNINGTLSNVNFANVALVEYAISKNTGNPGNYCFETSTNKLFGPKTGSVWPFATTLSYKITNEEKLMVSAGVPDDTFGDPDDFYYDRINSIMYGPKDISGWAPVEVIKQVLKIPNREAPLDSEGTVGDYVLMLQSARVYGPKEDLGWPVTYMKYPEYINSSLRIAVISNIVGKYSDLNNIDVYLHDNDTEDMVPYKHEDGVLTLFVEPGTWVPKGNAITYDNDRFLEFKGGILSGDPTKVCVLNDTLDTNCMVMSADARTVAVSSFSDDAGVVRVFQYVNTKWVQKGESIYGAWHEDFGSALSISDNGDVIAIGAQNRAEERSNLATLFQSFTARVGQVYVYKFENKIWSKDLDYRGKEEIGRCGYSLSLNGAGDVLAFTEPGHLRSKFLGRVRVIKFDYENQEWKPHGEMSNNATSRSFRDNIVAGATAGLTVGLLIGTIGPLLGPFGPVAMVGAIVGSVLAGVLISAVTTAIITAVNYFSQSPIDKTFLENSGRFHHASQIVLSSEGNSMMLADFRRNDFVPDQFIEKTSGLKALNFISNNIDVINFITTQTGMLISSLFTEKTVVDPDSFGNTRESTAIEIGPTAVFKTVTIGGQITKRTTIAATAEEDTDWAVVATKKAPMITLLEKLENVAKILDRSDEAIQAAKWLEDSEKIKLALTNIGAKPGKISKFLKFLKGKLFAPSIGPPSPLITALKNALRVVGKYVTKLVKYLKATKIFQHVTKSVSKVVKNVTKVITPIGKGLKNCSKLMKVAKFLGKVSIAFTILTFPSGLFDGFEYADLIDQAVSNSGKGIVRVYHLTNNKWEQGSGDPARLKISLKLTQNLPLPPGQELEVSSALLTSGAAVPDGTTVDAANLNPNKINEVSAYTSVNLNNVYVDGSYTFIGNEDLFAASATMSKNGQRLAVLGKHSIPGFVEETKDLDDDSIGIGIYRMVLETKAWYPMAYIVYKTSYPKLHQDLVMKLNFNGTKLIVGDPFYSGSDKSEFCGIVKVFTLPLNPGSSILQVFESAAEQIVGEYPYAQVGNPSSIDISNDGTNIGVAKRGLLPNIIVETTTGLIETSKHVSVYIRT